MSKKEPLTKEIKSHYMDILRKTGTEKILTFPSDITNDKDVALMAVTINPFALEFLSDNMKNNKEVVRRCIVTPTKKMFDHYDINIHRNFLSLNADFSRKEIPKSVFSHASTRLKNDIVFVSEIMDSIPDVYESASFEVRDNADISLKAIKNGNPFLYLSCSQKLRNNKEFVIDAILVSPKCIPFLNQKQKSDLDIMLKAIELSPKYAWEAMGDSLKSNKDILLETFKKNALLFDFELTHLPEVFNQFSLYIAKEKENFFINILQNIGSLEPSLKEYYPKPNNEKTIALILSHISKESLEKIKVKNEFLSKRIFQEINRKTILAIPNKTLKTVNKNRIKVF